MHQSNLRGAEQCEKGRQTSEKHCRSQYRCQLRFRSLSDTVIPTVPEAPCFKGFVHKYSRSPSQSVMTLLGYDRRLPQLGWDWSSRMPVEGRYFQYIGDISLLNMQHVLFVRILIVPQSLLRGSSSFLALLPKHHGLLYTSVQVGMLHVLHPEILKSIPSV